MAGGAHYATDSIDGKPRVVFALLGGGYVDAPDAACGVYSTLEDATQIAATVNATNGYTKEQVEALVTISLFPNADVDRKLLIPFLPESGDTCPSCGVGKIEAHDDCTDDHPVMYCAFCQKIWEVCD